MTIETALIVIVALLVVILGMLYVLVRWMSSFMDGMNEVISERVYERNADLNKLLKKRNYSKIISEITDKRLANSDDPELYWYKGVAHFYLKETSEARAVLRHAIDLDPSYEKNLMPYLKRLNRQDDNAPNKSLEQPGHE